MCLIAGRIDETNLIRILYEIYLKKRVVFYTEIRLPFLKVLIPGLEAKLRGHDNLRTIDFNDIFTVEYMKTNDVYFAAGLHDCYFADIKPDYSEEYCFSKYRFYELFNTLGNVIKVKHIIDGNPHGRVLPQGRLFTKLWSKLGYGYVIPETSGLAAALYTIGLMAARYLKLTLLDMLKQVSFTAKRREYDIAFEITAADPKHFDRYFYEIFDLADKKVLLVFRHGLKEGCREKAGAHDITSLQDFKIGISDYLLLSLKILRDMAVYIVRDAGKYRMGLQAAFYDYARHTAMWNKFFEYNRVKDFIIRDDYNPEHIARTLAINKGSGRTIGFCHGVGIGRMSFLKAQICTNSYIVYGSDQHVKYEGFWPADMNVIYAASWRSCLYMKLNKDYAAKEKKNDILFVSSESRQFRKMRRDMCDFLVDFLSIDSGISITLKPKRPETQNAYLYERLNKFINNGQMVITYDNVFPLIAESRVVVTNGSSVGVEALQMGVPAFYAKCNPEDEFITDNMGFIHCATPRELYDKIGELREGRPYPFTEYEGCFYSKNDFIDEVNSILKN